MDKFVINGGRKLKGRVQVEGSKNAALPIIAGSLMITKGPTILNNIPPLRDINTIIEVLRHLGARVEFDADNRKMVIDARKITENTAPYDMMRKMRASFLVLGPILSRMGEAVISLPGGCSLGPRPVDYHIKGFAALGAQISESRGYVTARAKKLKGGMVYFDRPSHTGTENIMFGAVMAEGATRIINAACDPEVIDLALFLNKAGAQITGYGTPDMVIEGVDKLSPVEYSVMGDRLEAGTFLMAAAAAGGNIEIAGSETRYQEIVLKKIAETGADIEPGDGLIKIRASGQIKPIDAVTFPYPGFPTDLQACLVALLTRADGISRVRETVFEDRFSHVMELRRLGADISVAANEATINGVKELDGTSIMASDIRAGAGLVIAGLGARGRTDILRIYHIDRGYYRLEEKLSALGADINRIDS